MNFKYIGRQLQNENTCRPLISLIYHIENLEEKKLNFYFLYHLYVTKTSFPCVLCAAEHIVFMTIEPFRGRTKSNLQFYVRD